MKLPLAIAFSCLLFALPSLADCTLENASLRMTLNDQGKITGLSSAPGGASLLDASRSSFLLKLQPYGAKAPLDPVSLKSETLAPDRKRLTLSYPGGYTATVEVTDKKKYTTHDLALANIYDRNHDLIGETPLPCLAHRLLGVVNGKPQHIALSAESTDAKSAPVIRMNLRTHDPLPEEWPNP